MGDKALALCRTCNLTFFIFSLPDCHLLKSFPMERSLNTLDLDQRFLVKDNTIMFMFFNNEFFTHPMDLTRMETKLVVDQVQQRSQ